MINATACFLRKDEEILFLYRDRGKKDIHKGYYVPPGGRFDRGESGIDCIVREFKEETGLTLIDPRLRVIATFYNEGRSLGNRKNPEDWQVELYEAYHFKGELKEEDERDKLVWVPETNVGNVRVYEGDRKILKLLKKEGVYQTTVRYLEKDLIEFKYKRVY